MEEPTRSRAQPDEMRGRHAEPKVLPSGLGIPESPRWHEGRLWFCNWIDRQVVAVGLGGKPEVMLTRDPASRPMGYSVVDGRGNIYINGADAHRVRYRRRRSLSNRRVFADGLGLDGICLDAEGAVWVSTAEFSIARVAEGGEVLHASNLARTGHRSR